VFFFDYLLLDFFSSSSFPPPALAGLIVQIGKSNSICHYAFQQCFGQRMKSRCRVLVSCWVFLIVCLSIFFTSGFSLSVIIFLDSFLGILRFLSQIEDQNLLRDIVGISVPSSSFLLRFTVLCSHLFSPFPFSFFQIKSEIYFAPSVLVWPMSPMSSKLKD
jgi:hypothetical protein